ncbi:Nif3-like dinuclear metal center hexameric protein [Helicobacter mustelae]|uniref:GTP cyclohydrolase 1 type 2 homolog n=1 Tax=Helicobacter mustelae (strain ATCC 43772 / CCUG 25715 / CIP 103759 / LMG 18044 / NCTC 12198 / R85-136P) TaxID=679897 RepID=D3UJC5_HELM1|nr:Nif3-like dinuclear metal center hexameric protein [Helicobacter mustelae]CBG40600.1 putative hypothetical protein [Helicobacter mustelae 12198]SQH72097.1 NIF3 family protein [Helicobacter mustelae]
MAKVAEIYALLQEISPFELQESWDNSGLQLGSLEDEFDSIVLALEIDEAVIEGLGERSLIIVHHPLIFKALKRLDFCDYPSILIQRLIEKKSCVIAMHTNFDITHLNLYVAREMLGFRNAQMQGSIAFASIEPTSLEALAASVQRALDLPVLKVCRAGEQISCIGIVCGSGFGLFPQVRGYKNFCFLTGDIKYHDGMQARAMGVSLIDIMHYESECGFVQILQRILQKKGYQAIISTTKNPFEFL